MSGKTIKIRLLFADDGDFHHEVVEIPAKSLKKYDRLIDCLIEDEDVLKSVHVDTDRLTAAYRVD